MSQINPLDQLLHADGLLRFLWPEEAARPSLRWLKTMTKNRAVPSIKVGKLRWYTPREFKAWLDAHYSEKPVETSVTINLRSIIKLRGRPRKCDSV
jgi:hypothetical protein